MMGEYGDFFKFHCHVAFTIDHFGVGIAMILLALQAKLLKETRDSGYRVRS